MHFYVFPLLSLLYMIHISWNSTTSTKIILNSRSSWSTTTFIKVICGYCWSVITVRTISIEPNTYVLKVDIHPLHLIHTRGQEKNCCYFLYYTYVPDQAGTQSVWDWTLVVVFQNWVPLKKMYVLTPWAKEWSLARVHYLVVLQMTPLLYKHFTDSGKLKNRSSDISNVGHLGVSLEMM